MGRWKAEMGRVREEKRRRKKIKKRKSQKKEDPGARKGRKVAKHCVFPMICGSGGSNSRLAKAWRVRSQLARWEMKNCTPLWREAHFEVKMYKAHQVRTTFGSWDVEKVHVVVARSTFRSKHVKNITCSDHFWRSDVVSRGSISKNDGRRGAFEEDLQRCIFRGRRSARDIFIRAVRRSGRWFPEKGCSLEHQIFRFAEMILRDRCSTSYVFRGRRSSLDRWNRKTHWHEAVSSALNFPFLKDISQNCFVFDVVNLNKWGRLAELFRFWCCQAQKLRTSRRIVWFLTLSSSKLEEVPQNCCVFKLAGRQTDRQTNR